MIVVFGALLFLLPFASSLNKPYQCNSTAKQKGPCMNPPLIGIIKSWPNVNALGNLSGHIPVNIGLLTTENPEECKFVELRFNRWFMYKRVAAAVQLAFERVNNNDFLGKYNRYMQYHWIDDQCHDGRSVLIAVKLITDKHIRALIGPTMSTQVGPVSRHASYLDIPLITAGGANEHFDDKMQEDYRTVIRMQDGYHELGNFIGAFFDKIPFTKVSRRENTVQNFLVYESWEKMDGGRARTEALFMCGALDIQLNRRNMLLSEVTYKSEGVRLPKEKLDDNATYTSLLDNIRKNTRGTDSLHLAVPHPPPNGFFRAFCLICSSRLVTS